jgi:hypothetical protein
MSGLAVLVVCCAYYPSIELTIRGYSQHREDFRSDPHA